MKRYLSYILILVIIIAAFGSINEAEAQFCWKDGGKLPLTPSRCGFAGGKWQDSGDPIPPPPYGPTQPDQECPPSQELQNGVCVDSSSTPVDPRYKLLAPITTSDGKGTGAYFDQGATDAEGKNIALSNYLNMMIKIFIGLCAVTAVIMIVVGGLEYMTSEAMSGKEDGKNRITEALLGLLIALGSYALLSTINPDLLNVEPYIADTEITFDEEEALEDAVLDDSGISAPAGPVIGCSQGIVRTASGIMACGGISQTIDKMINAARAAGQNITGGGYRTPQQQFALRTKYCGAGQERNPRAKCSRAVAFPGASRHNQGLAFDLKCNGTTIQNVTNSCFVWLKANAGKYGLINLPSEPWHWSIDGK